MSFRRMAGVSGLLSVVLFVASFIAYGSPPAVDASAAELAAYVADTGSYPLGNALGAIAALFMLVFVVGLAVPFGRSDREHGEGYGTVIVGSAVVAVTAISLAVALFAVLSNRIDGLDDATVYVLWDAGNLFFAVSILSFFLGAGATAAAIMRRGVMASWFGALSAIVALTSLTGLIPFFTNGGAVSGLLAGFLGFLVWALAGAVLLVRKE